MSAIDTAGDVETLTTLALHVLLVLIEYKPPSIENLRYLMKGGHPTMNKIYQNFLAKSGSPESPEEHAALLEDVLEDLTVNEHFRLLRVVYGRINLDPMYKGLSQFFLNIVKCQNLYLPNSSSVVPFHQEVFVYAWRLLTTN